MGENMREPPKRVVCLLFPFKTVTKQVSSKNANETFYVAVGQNETTREQQL